MPLREDEVERIAISPRDDYARKLEEIGFSFHMWDDYWKEDRYYRFTARQIDEIEEATNDLHQMCLEAVRFIIDRNRFEELDIPPLYWEAIKKSFNEREFSLYGRFDLAYDGVSPPKMLEYNADTPTSLLEASAAQWYWMEDALQGADQFNSIHDKMVLRWSQLKSASRLIHFASLSENEEDWVCTHYIMDTAVQAGFEARHIFVEDIGWSEEDHVFVDLDNRPIETLFKLYPWEWMMREAFGKHVIDCGTRFIEPIWKSVLSCKGLLPILWEMFPNHPNLLAAYREPGRLSSFAKKPIYSREGANIELYRNGALIASDPGPYGNEKVIYQELFNLKSFDGRYPIIGSWVVNGEAAGMGIREDSQPITTDQSNFVPHCFR